METIKKLYPNATENKNLQAGYRTYIALASVRGISIERLIKDYSIEFNTDKNGIFFNCSRKAVTP